MNVYVDEFPIAVVTDIHTKTDILDEIRSLHPEIPNNNWFCLGDLFSFRGQEFKQNSETAAWLNKNIKNYHFIIGNHEAVVMTKMINVDFACKHLVSGTFLKSINVRLPNGSNLFLCHNKPGDLWNHVTRDYTEREFEDDFGSVIKSDTIACVIGHTHVPKIHNFYATDCQIWNVGAVECGDYAIIDENGIHFKSISHVQTVAKR